MKLSERMRKFEQQETSRELMAQLPVLARMDGRAFHRFANKLEKPFVWRAGVSYQFLQITEIKGRRQVLLRRIYQLLR